MNLELLISQACMKGSDKAYRKWINQQLSCISWQFGEWRNGEGFCEAAHVRRAGKSGTGYKEPYACVPLTRNEHHTQTIHGEAALFDGWTNEQAKQWFDERRVKYLKKWLGSKNVRN